MQATPAQLSGFIEFAKSMGPTGILTAYLLYKDLYKPWKNGKTNGKSQLNAAAYVRESDFAGLSQTLRDHREVYRQDMIELRERLLWLERNKRA